MCRSPLFLSSCVLFAHQLDIIHRTAPVVFARYLCPLFVPCMACMCRPSVGPDIRPIKPANSSLVPYGLGLRSGRMFAFVPCLIYLFNIILPSLYVLILSFMFSSWLRLFGLKVCITGWCTAGRTVALQWYRYCGLRCMYCFVVKCS